MIDEIRELYEFNRWANERMLDAVAVLTEEELTRAVGGSFPSLRATLTHMVGAEWIWLSRWRGVSPTGLPESWDLSTHAAIRERWRAIDAERAAYLETLNDEALGRVVEYRQLSGAAYATPLWQLLRHVVNHASYHRGQVMMLLRQIGRPAVATDLVVFYRERTAIPAPRPAD
jgi:uncharacterized damage-inducible protein DinB